MNETQAGRPPAPLGAEVETQERARRLAVFLPALAGGGAERVMLNLADWFAADGIQVDLVLGRAEGELLTQVPPAVRIVDLEASRMLASLGGLARYVRRERPSALLSALSHANCVAIWACRLAARSVRVVVTEHSIISMTVRHSPRRRDRLLPFLMRRSYHGAEGVVAVSNGVARDLARSLHLPRERIDVIYNPIVSPSMLAAALEPCPHPWLDPGALPVVLAVGRLTREKDHASLIRAFAILRRSHAVRLLILGEGVERNALLALVQELGLEADVELPGFVANPLNYMKHAAMLALSSRWEGFGNVLVEAMAVGTPVVSTDCPDGPAEILEGGRWGRLVPVGDVQRLAAAMREVLAGPNPDARERAAQFFVEAAALQYRRLLFPDLTSNGSPSDQAPRTEGRQESTRF